MNKDIKLIENNVIQIDKHIIYKRISNTFLDLKKIYNCDYEFFCISITGVGFDSLYTKNVFITNSNNIDQLYLKNNLLMHDPIPIIEQNLKTDSVLDFNECYEYKSNQFKKIDGNMLKKFLQFHNISNGIFFFFKKIHYVISYRFVCDLKSLKFSKYNNFCKHFIDKTIFDSEMLYSRSLELNTYLGGETQNELN